DLNGSHYQILDASPTPLEFSRIVHIGRPALIRSKACEIPEGMSRWTDRYLIERMGERKISIAVTPTGRADAITQGPDGRLFFAEPHVETMTMGRFLEMLHNVHYLQSQNGNLYTARYYDSVGDSDPSEFEPLRGDVPSEVPWCSEALDRSPDAVNLWIGNSASVTSIHSDPYENIYSVVRGKKHFTLLP
ncbi:predicted protein, partial [Postia placenta Mad-698-R]